MVYLKIWSLKGEKLKKIRVYEVKAFSKGDIGGNLAGVVIGDTDDSVKQRIARELGYSETVFVDGGGDEESRDYKLEFFTPTDQVDLCGHATIGAFSLLRSLGKIEEGEYWQNGLAGRLRVRVEESKVLMEQKTPGFYGRADKRVIAKSLGIEEDVIERFPVEIVSTGLKDILIPVKSLESLKNIKPDFERIKKVSKRYGVVGYHVFSLESLEGSTAFTRNFAPLYDIDEEAATGTSNGALAAYLKKYEIVNNNRMVFEQGDFMDSPSRIEAEIDNGCVWVGGQGSLVREFELVLT